MEADEHNASGQSRTGPVIGFQTFTHWMWALRSWPARMGLSWLAMATAQGVVVSTWAIEVGWL